MHDSDSHSDSCITLIDLCDELEYPIQFVLDLANSAEDEKRYNSYKRLKKSGGVRYINASVGSLKRLQRTIYERLLTRHRMPEHVHGGVKGRSIVTNASAHIGKKVVINIDLTNFFSSIKSPAVKQIFVETFKCDDETANVLAQLSTFKGALPTGAPTSSALANIAAFAVDEAIVAALTQHIPRTEFGYSRYVDDITISGDDRLVDRLPGVYEAVQAGGFTCNERKTRILRRSTRQWVTGVVVNQKPNPPKHIIRKVRQSLYYMKRWGLEEHCETHGINPYKFMRQLTGYIAYVRLTQPELADQFLKTLRPHLARFNAIERDSGPTVLSILKALIDNEMIAHFMYDREGRPIEHPLYEPVRISVAPESLDVDDDGKLTMRGFELAPNQRWEIYNLDGINYITDKPFDMPE